METSYSKSSRTALFQKNMMWNCCTGCTSATNLILKKEHEEAIILKGNCVYFSKFNFNTTRVMLVVLLKHSLPKPKLRVLNKVSVLLVNISTPTSLRPDNTRMALISTPWDKALVVKHTKPASNALIQSSAESLFFKTFKTFSKTNSLLLPFKSVYKTWNGAFLLFLPNKLLVAYAGMVSHA